MHVHASKQPDLLETSAQRMMLRCRKQPLEETLEMSWHHADPIDVPDGGTAFPGLYNIINMVKV